MTLRDNTRVHSHRGLVCGEAHGSAPCAVHRYVHSVESNDLAPPNAARRSVVLSSGVELSVIDNERNEASRAWLLVHGLSSNARLWDGVLRRLTAEGDRVIAVDQRGHGHSQSSPSGYEMGIVADDLAELAKSLDIAQLFLVGQSWGGNVVLECSARHGVGIGGRWRRRWLHSPKRSLSGVGGMLGRIGAPVLEGVPLQRIEQWLTQSAADWPEEGRRGTLANFIVREDGTISPRLNRDDHHDVLAGLWRHEPADALLRTTAPVRFFVADSGDADRRAQRRSAIDALVVQGGSRVDAVWFEGAHHDVHAQRPDDVTAALLEFAGHHS